MLPSIKLICCVAAYALLFCWLSAVRAGAPRIIEEFHFADGGDLLLPVSLGGKEYLFALDTGTTGFVYDSSLRGLLGDRRRFAQIDTGERTERVEWFESPRIFAGRIALSSKAGAVCFDLEMVRRASGEEVFGMVGIEALKDYVVAIDFDNRFIRFQDSVASDAGSKIALVWHNGRDFREGPFVLAQLPGVVRKEFLVDTGMGDFASGGIEKRLYDALDSRGAARGVGLAKLATIGRETDSQMGQVDHLLLDDFTIHQPVFHRLDENVLGIGYWSRYSITFDFPNDAMYLRKGKRFHERDVFDLSGLHILRGNVGVVVDSVDESSPAAASRICAGDLLISVDGIETSRSLITKVRRQLCDPGSKTLVLMRGDDTLEIHIALGSGKPLRPASGN